MMTDERQGDGLLRRGRAPARGDRDRVPPLRPAEVARRDLFERVAGGGARPGPARGAGRAGAGLGADGSHGRGRGRGLRGAPVHDQAQIRAAERNGADFLFLSPVYATASHKEPAAGLARFAGWPAARAADPLGA